MSTNWKRWLLAGLCATTAGTLGIAGLTSAQASAGSGHWPIRHIGMAAPTEPTEPADRAETGRQMPVAVPDQAQPLAAGSAQFIYAGASATGAADGASASMSIASPTLASNDYHTLAEIAVESADGQQIVEVGWNVDRSLNRDARPHLFVYHWVSGGTSCYNGCGFVSTSSSIRAGQAVPTGAQRKFGIEHSDGKWWTLYDGQRFGYFPDSLWSGRFTRAGLIQWFGEVAASSSRSCTDMGSGVAASDASAASISSIATTGGGTPALRTYATQPSMYSVAKSSGTSIRFGGAGAC